VHDDHNIAMERINYFMTEVVSRSVFVEEHDTETIVKYTNASIPVLTVPFPGPYDPLIQAVIVTKMNKILEDALIISDSELLSAYGGYVSYVWDAADEEDAIHSYVNDEDDGKWWAVPEPRFASYPEDMDASDYSDEDTMTWDKLNLHWSTDPDMDELEEELDIMLRSETLNGNVLKFSDFNPKKRK